MSMQSVLLTAALHYILSPSSLSPLSPLSPLLQLVCCLPRLPTPSPSFCLSNTISACYPPFVSSCSTDTVRTCGPPPPPSSPLLTLPLSAVFCLHPSRFCVCSPACVGWLEYVVLSSLPNLHPSLSSLSSLSLCVSFSLTESPPPFASPTSLLPFLLFCGLSAFPCLFPLPRSRCLKTFQACLIIFLHVAGFVSMCVSAFSSGCLRKHKPFFQNVSFTVRGRRTHI